ncbi:endonuclease [Candidatus Micrarchaeota archaeon RBG_16_49_10]|nr:MAG: endonuclease [Candidatus Micrarchaeota archaeon RBG_16_49_10]
MLLGIYNDLYQHFGSQHWWPAQTPFEVIVGAILTQQTSWNNVEKAIVNLKREKILDPKKLREIESEKLETLIKPSGYYRQKTKKLKNFMGFLFERHGGKLEELFGQSIEQIRMELLSVKGIGKETADSIILYAANKPTFVIDAYTVRAFNRIGVTKEKDYESLKKFFEDNLPKDVNLFNEYHALIVALGKNYCRTNPICGKCPLRERCDYALHSYDGAKRKK